MNITRTRLSIEHCRLECTGSFQDVHSAVLGSIPALRPELGEMLARGEREKVTQARRDWPALWLFEVRDHGALTAADGQRSSAFQYEIGNPLTAERMTRHVLAAGLYAPLRVFLYQHSGGTVFFEYDLPSSLFAQFGDDRVTAVGTELDSELESALMAASVSRGAAARSRCGP